MYEGKTTDLDVARALGWQPDKIDIYSCSWGPTESNSLGLGNLTQWTLENATREVCITRVCYVELGGGATSTLRCLFCYS